MTTIERMLKGINDTDQTVQELNAKGSTIGGAIDSMLHARKEGLTGFCHYHQEKLYGGEPCYTCNNSSERV